MYIKPYTDINQRVSGTDLHSSLKFEIISNEQKISVKLFTNEYHKVICVQCLGVELVLW